MDRYEEMKEAVLDGDEELAAELAKKALKDGLPIQKAMDAGFLSGIKEAGRLYEEEEYFLPELVCSADAMKSALAVLDAALKSGAERKKSKGSVALVTVKGDVHDIGKTIVGAMLTASGYEVFDLGTDIDNEEVISKVLEIKPDILGLSALLSTTMEEQKNIINLLKSKGLSEEIKVIVGGAPVNQEWADEIEAHGYSDNALAAVVLVDGLIGRN